MTQLKPLFIVKSSPLDGPWMIELTNLPKKSYEIWKELDTEIMLRYYTDRFNFVTFFRILSIFLRVNWQIQRFMAFEELDISLHIFYPVQK